MTELESNGIKLKIRATNLARHYFYQEFDSELDDTVKKLYAGVNSAMAEAVGKMDGADVEALRNGDMTVLAKYGLTVESFADVKRFPELDATKVIWAMNMAARKADGEPLAGYAKLLEEQNGFYAEDCTEEMWEEIRAGFFRQTA